MQYLHCLQLIVGKGVATGLFDGVKLWEAVPISTAIINTKILFCSSILKGALAG